MATLNELGRNSSSLTYGPFATGQDLWQTLAGVDQWFRNDTWQGTATTSGYTVTGSGTIFTTQARVGDVIMIAGQIRTVTVVNSDTSITVGTTVVLPSGTVTTSGYSPSITVPSAIKVIYSIQATQTQGYITNIIRGATNGVVSVTNNSNAITGVGTYFLSDATNSIATVAVQGSFAIDTLGNITGTSGFGGVTSFVSGQGGNNGLYPGDCIAITINYTISGTPTPGAVYYFTIATVTNDTTATVTVPPTTAITGASCAKAVNGVTGRYININGRLRQIATITSNTTMTVNQVMDFTDSNLHYKTYPRGTLSNVTTTAASTFVGANITTITAGTTFTTTAVNGYLIPGTLIVGTTYTTSATPTLTTVGTTIVSQLYGTSGTTAATSTISGTSGTNQLTTATSISGQFAVGQLITGNGAVVAGIPASTYITGISGTSPTLTLTLNNNITATFSSVATIFAVAPGLGGTYIASQSLGNATAFTTSNMYSNAGSNTNFFWDLGVNNLNNTVVSSAYMYQTSTLDQVWFGDEIRTIQFNSFNGTIGFASLGSSTISYTAGANCYLTDYLGYTATTIGVLRQPVWGITYKREDSLISGINTGISGTTTAFLSDLRIGDDLIIDGTECTVTAIPSNTQFKVNFDFTHSTAPNSGAAATFSSTSTAGSANSNTVTLSSVSSTTTSLVVIGQLVTGAGIPVGTYVTNLVGSVVTLSANLNIAATGTYSFYNGSTFYKKLKLHGYFLEGTREGGGGGYLYTPSTSPTLAANVTLAPAAASSSGGSSTVFTVTTVSSGTFQPGQILGNNATTLIPAGTTILNQITAAATAGNITAMSGVGGTNTLTATAGTLTGTVAAGQLVSGAGTQVTGIATGTYVLSVVNSSPGFVVTLSQNLTSTISAQTISFGTAGGAGTYTTNNLVALGAGSAATTFAQTTGKWSQSTYLFGAGLATPSYPIGTTSIQVNNAPIQWTGSAFATSTPFNFIKISGGGGPPIALTGQVTGVQTTVTGTNTLFTSQLHIGAEIVVAGQYLTVVSIISDTLLLVQQQMTTVPLLTPIYRSVPLYTYMTSISGASAPFTITIATPLKNNLYATYNSALTVASNPPTVSFPSNGGDFLEYVYSAPNYNAEFTTTGTNQTTTVLNQSLDRKYVGFRVWPLWQSTNALPTGTSTISTAVGAFATPVYERWAAGYAQTHGVGVNMSDLSGGVVFNGVASSTTTLTLTAPIAGSLQVGMAIQSTVAAPNLITALAGTNSYAGTQVSQYTTTSLTNNVSGGAIATGLSTSVFAASLNGVYDIQAMSQTTGGYLYLFGNKRYFIIQGKSFANAQTQWQGCVEFERAQPEDVGTGLGSTSGISFAALGGTQLSQGASAPSQTIAGFSQSVQFLPGIAPWPCFAYVNGNRFPTGSGQTPTYPNLQTYPIHGGVLATPRVRNSAGDLVGVNAHVYSACTITTGRWGHTIEFGAIGSYAPSYLPAAASTVTVGSNILTNTANNLPQIHLGQIVPTYTNVYNSKRFMFSPVVVLGPAYDPDVRGRFFGLKIIPSNLGTLMDTVSITSDTNYFYNTSFSAVDHWVIGSPANSATVNASGYPGQGPVLTQRFTTTQNTATLQQSWRSLEDTSAQSSNTSVTFTNNFRMALPA